MKTILNIFIFGITVFIYWFWVTSLKLRYEEVYLFSLSSILVFVLVCLFYAFHVPKRYVSIMIYGFFLGYISSFFSNLILDFLFVEHAFDNLVLGLKNNTNQVLVALAFYPLILGGWFFGIVCAVFLKFTPNISLIKKRLSRF